MLHGAVDKETENLLFAAAEINGSETQYAKGMTQGYISLILGKLLPMLSLEPIKHGASTVEQRMIEYCSMHYCEPITLTSVAEALGYSPTHLSHLFSEKFKIGFSEFISTLRMEDAKKMLHGEKPITQIALDCGFGSMRNFNRVFKASTGKTPSEYRNAKKHP